MKNKYIRRFNENYDKKYLDEVKKANILSDLKSIEKYISALYNTINKSKYLDNDTKKNILELREMTNKIFNLEIDKELKRQKDDGKDFLSDSDVDELIDRINHDL